MISIKLIIYLSIGTAAMLVPIVIQARKYGIAWWKSLPIALCLTIVGTAGTYILFYVENGWVGGTSFFGAVFLVPLLFPAVAKLLNEDSADLLDICAPAECIMLVIMKIQCQISNCCRGREIVLPISQFSIQFPSQLAELLNAVFIFFVLIRLSRNEMNHGHVYPWYMIIYGGSRFVLNIFREAWVTRSMFLPYGNIWSLVAIFIGVIWLFFALKRESKLGRSVYRE